MIRILFVCYGNICRSPMGEFILKDLVRRQGMEDQFLIASAAVSAEETGNPVYPPARRKLQEHGISCEGKRAVQMVKSDYARYDYLLAAEERNLSGMKRIAGGDPERKMFRLLYFSDRPRNIADPWYTGDFDTAYREIREGCESFLHYLKQQGICGKKAAPDGQ